MYQIFGCFQVFEKGHAKKKSLSFVYRLELSSMDKCILSFQCEDKLVEMETRLGQCSRQVHESWYVFGINFLSYVCSFIEQKLNFPSKSQNVSSKNLKDRKPSLKSIQRVHQDFRICKNETRTDLKNYRGFQQLTTSQV